MQPTFARLTPIAFVIISIGCSSTSLSPKEPPGSTSAATSDPEYDRLCSGVAPEHRAKCPIGAWTQSAEDVEGGVLLHLNVAAPPPDETQRRMRCHRAWMAHDPSNAMPRCPLGSPGITITAISGSAGTNLALIASKPEDVQEVRRRAHAALGR